MNAMTLDRWVPFRNEGDCVRCRIFSFPHAGGNAALYRPLQRLMPPEVDFCPVELPGRAARLREPPITSMSTLVERLHHVLRPLMDVPYGFFGHSVGTSMAFEATRQLGSFNGRTAVHLFVSGRASPKVASRNRPPARSRSDSELLAILDHFGGTPAAIMQHPELIAALLPALRADLTLAEGYTIDPSARVACPITAFGGIDDVSHSNNLRSWRDCTRGTFRTFIFPGGHFYFWPAAEMLAGEIVDDLRTTVGVHASPVKPQI
jgi:medium-chain acyl-[acyl-carrier-protein] hydrolase